MTSTTFRLDFRQLYFLLVAVTVPTEMDLLPSAILRAAHRDAPYAVLLGGLGAALTLVVAIFILRRSPFTYVELLVRSFGRWGRVVLFVAGCILLVGMVNIFALALLPVRIIMLPHTSSLMLTGLGIFLIWYIASGGPYATAQVATTIMTLMMVVVFFLLPLTAKYMEWGFILPPWPLHLDRVLQAMPGPFGFLNEATFVLVFATWARSKEEAISAASWALVTDIVLLLLAVVVPLLVFGPEYASNLALPFTSSIRSIHYGFILERLDVFAAVIWIVGIGVKDAVWALAAAYLLSSAFGRPSSSLIILILVGGTAGLSYWLLPGLANVTEALKLWWTEAAVPLWLAVLLFSLVAVFRIPKRLEST